MWDKKMIVTTASAIVGVLMVFASMLQGITLGVRYGAIGLMLLCCIVFVLSFLSLGTES